MSPKVGILRALLYYYYYPLWKTYFEELGAQVVLSEATSKSCMNEGVRMVVDEACLPVKLAFGHAAGLKESVDFLFLPRIVSVARKEYICPKFLGFPDMVKQNIQGLPEVIDVTINLHDNSRQLLRQLYKISRHFTSNPLRMLTAYRKSVAIQKKYETLLAAGVMPEKAMAKVFGDSGMTSARQDQGKDDLAVAVIGHPYNVYDPYINMNLLKKLKNMGASVHTAENLPETIAFGKATWLPKKLFWTLGQRMTGAAAYYLEDKAVDGIVHISAFGCGPDSLIGELIERYARHQGKIPFLNLTLDEHTGEAGLVTRLEAFIDMVRWRRAQA